jgi:hypothetical protein
VARKHAGTFLVRLAHSIPGRSETLRWIQKSVTVVLICASQSQAVARELTPQEAIEFVPGKWWKFSCSILFGMLRFQGEGLVRENGCVIFRIDDSKEITDEAIRGLPRDKFSVLGAGTIVVTRARDGTPESICSTPVLMGFKVCFTVDKIDEAHFTGKSVYRPSDNCKFTLIHAPANALLTRNQISKCSAVP